MSAIATVAAPLLFERPINLKRTLGPLVIEWIEANLVHGPGDVQGQPIHLDDDQVAFVLRAYEIDDRGRRVVRRGVYSRAKGRAKSELMAMLACAEGAGGPVRFSHWGPDGYPVGRPVIAPCVLCAATEEGQADNVYGAVYFMLREGPIAAMPVLDVGLTRTFTPGNGKIAPITAKASSKDGGKETFVPFDETHLYITPELRSLHATLRRNLTKRKAAEPWSCDATTMYAPGEESVAELAHRYALRIAAGELVDSGFLFDHREGFEVALDVSDAELLASLAEAYGEAAVWTDLQRKLAEFRDPANDWSDSVRYFLNLPMERTAGKWITDAQWAALADAAVATGPGDAPVHLGFDGSRSYDTTVAAWAWRLDDGRIAVKSHVWSTRREAPHHELVDGGEIDFEAFEAFVEAELFDSFEVVDAAYDPRYLIRSMQLIEGRVGEARIAPVEPQSKLMRDAIATFHELLFEGRLVHDGDPVLAAHVAAATAEEDDKGWVVRKRKQSKPIDALIASILAVWRCSLDEGDDVIAEAW